MAGSTFIGRTAGWRGRSSIFARTALVAAAVSVLVPAAAPPAGVTAISVSASARTSTEAHQASVLVRTSLAARGSTSRARAWSGGASYAFLSQEHGGGAIARWDPCSGPIGYRVNLALAPQGALADVREAVRRISAVTGLRFAYRGTTSVVPGSRSDIAQGYPADTQLVVAWVRPSATRLLPRTSGSLPLAMGAAQWVPGFHDGSGRHWASIDAGAVVVDATQRTVPGFATNRQSTRGKMLMHELGHVVGLAHVSNPTQVMYPVIDSYPAQWGSGDRTGLRILGAKSGCLHADR